MTILLLKNVKTSISLQEYAKVTCSVQTSCLVTRKLEAHTLTYTQPPLSPSLTTAQQRMHTWTHSLFTHFNKLGKNQTSGQKLCSTWRETCCSGMASKIQQVKQSSPCNLTLNWDCLNAINPLTLLSLFAFNSLTKYTAKEQLFYWTVFLVWLVSLKNLQNQICLQLFKLSPVSLSEYFPYAMTNLFTPHFILSKYQCWWLMEV